MGRRSDIDWEAINREYVAGQLTIRQIADRHGVAPSAITRKAKALEWERNLGDAIKERTKAKIAQIDIAHIIEQSAQEDAQKSAQTLKKAIEEASDVAAGVIVRHRADIRLQQERAARLEALFDEMIDKTPSTTVDADSRVEALNVGDVFKLSQTFKAIIESRSKLMDKEREAFGIESGDKGGDDKDLNIEVKFV